MSAEKLKEKPKSFRKWLANAFATGDPNFEFTENDLELLGRVAGWVVDRGMSTPAVLFLETMRPLGYIGSQALVLAEPIIDISFSTFPAFLKKSMTIDDYKKFTELLEHRDTVELLIQKITSAENRGKTENTNAQ